MPSTRPRGLVAGFGLGLVVAWTGISCWRAGALRPADPLPRHVRHAMVLDGQGVSGSRAFEGLRLLREGSVDTLVLSGVQIGGGFFYSMVWARMLPLAPSERSRVLELRSDCHSTQNEAILADSVFHALGDDTVVVVTSSYHVWRAASIFRRRSRSGTVFVVHGADDPYWDLGWSDRESCKMRFLEWTKRSVWVLWEQWAPAPKEFPASQFARGVDVGRIPPSAWTP